MQLSKYIRCTANGKWKFRKLIPKRYQEVIGRRELKGTLASTDIHAVVIEAMTICGNFAKVLQNIDMGNDYKNDLTLTQLVTVGNLSKKKDGSVSVQSLSFDPNDPKDQAEVLALLNLKKVSDGGLQAASNQTVFKLSKALEVNKTARSLSPATLKKLLRVYQLAFDIIGDIDLNSPDAKGKMTEFLVQAAKEPARRSQIKELKGLSYAQQIRYAEKHSLPIVSKETTTNLANLFSSSIEAVLDLDSRLTQNPLSYKQTGKVVGKTKPRNKFLDDAVGFTPQELEVIFKPENLRKISEPSLLIGMLIGMHTGMRLNEVASLHIHHCLARDGVFCFDLTDWAVGLSDGKQPIPYLKTGASKRLIPLSEGLIASELLDYIELVKQSGAQLLLPDMYWSTANGYGRKLGRGFMNYLESLGLGREKGFHELRGTLNDGLKQAQYPLEFREDLLGHSNRSMNSRSYTNPAQLILLKEMVNKISLPRIKISDYFDKKYLENWLNELKKKQSRPKITRIQ